MTPASLLPPPPAEPAPRSWLARPVRCLGRLVRPSSYGLSDLACETGRFVLSCRLRPGWVRLRLSTAGGAARWRVVEGRTGGCLLETPPVSGTAGEVHLPPARPAHSPRLQPIR